MRIGGSRRPSWWISVASAGSDPGADPPISAWWARLATQPTSRPSVKQGATSVMSFRCVPPANGSLTTACSPGPSRSPNWSITAATDAGIEPRWTGMCSAWARSRPDGSNTAAEQSARSLMFGLKAARWRTAPISSAIPDSLAISTWNAAGSLPRPRRPSGEFPAIPDRPGDVLTRSSDRSRALGGVAAAAGEDQRSERTLLADPAVGHPDGAVLAHHDLRADDRLGPSSGPATEDLVDGRRRRGRGDRPQGRHLDDGVGMVVPVPTAVLGRELGDRRDPELMALAGVAAVECNLDVGVRHAERGPGVIGQRREGVVEPVVVGRDGPGPDDLALAGRGQQSDRGQHPGGGGDDHRRHAHRVGQIAGVQRTGTAEPDQRQTARVDSPLDRHRPKRPLHAGVDDRQHALGIDARVGQRTERHRHGRERRGEANAASGGIRPATRFASVTVGRVPPRP